MHKTSIKDITTDVYTIKFEKLDGSVLCASVDSSENTVELAKEIWNHIRSMSDELEIDKILFIEYTTKRLNITQLYKLTSFLTTLMSNKRVAFLNPQFKSDYLFKFAENVALNRGGSGGVFADKEKALEFLSV